MVHLITILGLVSTFVLVKSSVSDDPARDQIVQFKKEHPEPIGLLTTSAGAPIELRDATKTINRNLLTNNFFIESIVHQNRERIPERTVHAKGSGAFGYFEVTHDISNICKAKLFSEIGKKTPVAVRFSLVSAEKGGSELSREARGFAVKFYTEDGNFDIVGLNTPMFAIKDPLFFPTFSKAQKRNPSTNLNDNNMLWDFVTLRPETLNVFLRVFSDLGIPDGYRYMPGYGIHTYEVVDKYGHQHFVRFHFLPDLGIKNLTNEEATRIQTNDFDYATRDLYNAIDKGQFPSWTVSVQVLSLEDVKHAKFDVFDVTKELPIKDYPLRPVGKLVINKNPVNYFAEVEQLAFCPCHLVSGILGGPDKLFEARRFAYMDAENYRLGVNFNRIPVNCPFRAETNVYNRDGRAPVKDNEKDIPNYFPNSFNGPMPYVDHKKREIVNIVQDDDPNNFKQAAHFYKKELNKAERSRLIDNIIISLRGVTKFLQERAIELFTIIHPEIGIKVATGLYSNKTILIN